jgi:hypothetical protein
MRTVTLLQLRTRAKELADMVGSSFLSDDEWNDLANRYVTEVYDLLVQAGPPDYYSDDATITTVPGQLAYDLPDDFRSLENVRVLEPNLRERPINAMQDRERGFYTPVRSTWTVKLEYIAAPPLLEADDATFDGVSGWDELIVLHMAQTALDKEETPHDLARKIEKMEARIRTNRPRDRGAPRFITDLGADERATFWWTQTSPVQRYRLRAGKLEIYEPLYGPPV